MKKRNHNHNHICKLLAVRSETYLVRPGQPRVEEAPIRLLQCIHRLTQRIHPPAWTSSSSCTSSMGRSLTPDCRDLRRAASTPHARTGFNVRTLNAARPQTDNWLKQMTTLRETEIPNVENQKRAFKHPVRPVVGKQPKDGGAVIKVLS